MWVVRLGGQVWPGISQEVVPKMVMAKICWNSPEFVPNSLDTDCIRLHSIPHFQTCPRFASWTGTCSPFGSQFIRRTPRKISSWLLENKADMSLDWSVSPQVLAPYLYIFLGCKPSQISFLDYPRWTIPTKFHHFPSFPSCSIIFHHFHHVRSFLHLLGSWIFHHFPSFSNIFQHVPKSSKIPALDPYPNWYKLVHGWESHSPGDSAAGLWVRSDRQRFPGPWEVPKMALTRII